MKEKKEINIKIGENIKRERERAHLTQEQLSEMIKVGPKSLSAIERGAVGISLSLLQKICKVLSISSDALIFGETTKRNARELYDCLERLTPTQCEIATEILMKLMEAFTLNENNKADDGLPHK